MIKKIFEAILIQDYDEIRYKYSKERLKVIHKLYDDESIKIKLNSIMDSIPNNLYNNNIHNIHQYIDDYQKSKRNILCNIYVDIIEPNNLTEEILKICPDFFEFLILSNSYNTQFISNEYITDELIILALENDPDHNIIRKVKNINTPKIIDFIENDIYRFMYKLTTKDIIETPLKIYIHLAGDFIITEDNFLDILSNCEYTDKLFIMISESNLCKKYNNEYNEYVRKYIKNILNCYYLFNIYNLLDDENRYNILLKYQYFIENYENLSVFTKFQCEEIISSVCMFQPNDNLLKKMRILLNRVENKTEELIIKYVENYNDYNYMINSDDVSEHNKIECYLKSISKSETNIKFFRNMSDDFLIKAIKINFIAVYYVNDISINIQREILMLNPIFIESIKNCYLEIYESFMDKYPDIIFYIRNKKHRKYLISKNYKLFSNCELKTNLIYYALSTENCQINNENFNSQTFNYLLTTYPEYIEQFSFVISIIFERNNHVKYINILSNIIKDLHKYEKLIFLKIPNSYINYKYQNIELNKLFFNDLFFKKYPTYKNINYLILYPTVEYILDIIKNDILSIIYIKNMKILNEALNIILSEENNN